MIITDWGLLIGQPPTPEKPWTPAKAHLKDPMGYEDLRVRMAEAGVDRAILVPPSFSGGRNEFLLEAAAQYPGQFSVMASIPVNKPGGRQVFENLLGQPGRPGGGLTFPSRHHEGRVKG